MSATAAQTDLMDAAAYVLYERAGDPPRASRRHICLGSEGYIVMRAHGTIRERGHGRIALFGYGEWKQDHANAEFAATMTPDFAVMLAGWLQVKAANPGDHDYGYALAVAEAVLNPEARS